jgi:hypothetical protein
MGQRAAKPALEWIIEATCVVIPSIPDLLILVASGAVRSCIEVDINELDQCTRHVNLGLQHPLRVKKRTQVR